MAPLVTTAQFGGLQPDIQAAIQSGQRTRAITQEEANRQRLIELEQSQLETRQRALGVPSEIPDEETQVAAQFRAIADDPVLAQQFFKTAGIDTEAKREGAAASAFTIRNAPIEQREELINKRVLQITARGGDPKDTLELLDMTPSMQNTVLSGVEAAALTAAQRQVGERIAGKKPDIDPVQSSKILDDGTVQIVRRSGAIEVKSPESSKKDLIKRAQEFGAGLQGLRAGERDAAKAAIKQSIDAFKKLVPVKKNIKNLTEGIRLIDEGAQTGVIAKRFPSIKTASIELDNLQGRLGLDIIADVTFGALSESELAFAKDTALPIGLEGEPLKEWLNRKRNAQKILVESLEEAALFLGEPKNTIPDYIRLKRAQQAPTAALPQGVSEEDITETMRANNMTRQQVLNRLGGR